MTAQKRTAFDWNDVRFLALARTGSLSAAARSMSVNHATVARRIGALEAALGHMLFERRADGYGLTVQGETALALAVAAETAMLAFPESLLSEGSRGLVRIATVRSLADAFLVDRLGALAQTNPGITLEIVTDTRLVSLARREADIALRLGRPKDSSLVGRPVARICYAFYAAVGHPDADAAPLIAYDRDSQDVAEAAWLESTMRMRPTSFRSNSNEAQAAAARAGFGLAMLPRYLGDQDRGLMEVKIADPHPPRELWLISPRELARTPRVRLVLDCIAQICSQEAPLLEGLPVRG